MAGYYGYTGIMKPPIQDPTGYGPSVYCISDKNYLELIIIPLEPDFFEEAYKIAKNPRYQKVIICVPATDIRFISDLFNLIMSLYAIKPVYWVYPNEVNMNSTLAFETTHINSTYYMSGADSSINVVYYPSIENNSTVWDIGVKNGIISAYFSQYTTDEKFQTINNNNYITEYHMSYLSPIYGGLNFQNISITNKLKIRLHSFSSVDELNYCNDNYSNLVGRCAYNEFI
jgi:hypothetical protein